MAHLKLDSSSSDSQFAILSTKKEERKKEMPKSSFQSLAIESHEALSSAFHIIQ